MTGRAAIVVVNWGPPDGVTGCIQSILDSGLSAADTVVVDNHHPARDSDVILKRYPGVSVVTPSANLGFAGGANAGIAWAGQRGFEFVFVANNDLAVNPATIPALLDAMSSNPSTGVAGALPCYADSGEPHFTRGDVDFRRGKPIILQGEPARSAPYETAFATGCCVLLRADALADAGPFDESYFLYWEDVDLCFRMRRNGYATMMVPGARARHEISATTGHSSPLNLYYQTRNRLKFVHAHAPNPALGAWLVLRITFSRGLRGLRLALAGRTRESRAYWLGIADFFAGRGGIRADYHVSKDGA